MSSRGIWRRVVRAEQLAPPPGCKKPEFRLELSCGHHTKARSWPGSTFSWTWCKKCRAKLDGFERMLEKGTMKKNTTYKLYSADLRRHLEIRAPYLEGSNADPEVLRKTEAWKHRPSVITDEAGAFVDSNLIDIAHT